MSASDSRAVPMPMFLTGRVVATLAALRLLAEADTDPLTLVTRHVYGDWQEMPSDDQLQNVLAIRDGFRVFSSFVIAKGMDVHRVWVITEADRSVTTLLLPEDY